VSQEVRPRGVEADDLALRRRLFEALAGRTWWGNWRARTLEQSQAILDGVGRTGAFWRLS
jgi:hypothetical protein